LREIGFEQYSETFLVNFPSREREGYLSRKRLKELRLKDFSQLNITQYDHQKLIFEHIKHTLLFEFRSPIRRRGSKGTYLCIYIFTNITITFRTEVSMRTKIKFEDDEVDEDGKKDDFKPSKLFEDESKVAHHGGKKDKIDKKKGFQMLFIILTDTDIYIPYSLYIT